MPNSPERGRRGFIAMEYYWMILNRSFLVFTYPEGLYGWKFRGPVSARTPAFFLPFEDTLNDPDLVPGSNDFKEMMNEAGSFSIPRSEIASAEFDASQKWGMGPVPHSGKLYLRLSSGVSREFILLGKQDGDAVCAAVLSGTPIVTSS